MGCLLPIFPVLGVEKRGQKRPFLGGPKSPILARGHMGKTADFNQIVLYLETPNLVEYGLPTSPFRHSPQFCTNKKGPPRPSGPKLIVLPAAVVKEADT